MKLLSPSESQKQSTFLALIGTFLNHQHTLVINVSFSALLISLWPLSVLHILVRACLWEQVYPSTKTLFSCSRYKNSLDHLQAQTYTSSFGSSQEKDFRFDCSFPPEVKMSHSLSSSIIQPLSSLITLPQERQSKQK